MDPEGPPRGMILFRRLPLWLLRPRLEGLRRWTSRLWRGLKRRMPRLWRRAAPATPRVALHAVAAEPPGGSRWDSARPRVGAIWSVECIGGVHTWRRTLRQSETRIRWSGTALHLVAPIDAEAVRRLNQPFYTHHPVPPEVRDLVRSTSSWTEAVQRVVNDSDVLLAWGPNLAPGLEKVDFQGKPVVVQAFGSCEWTRSMVASLLPFSTHGMAISRSASRTFPPEFQSTVRVLHPGISLEHCRPRKRREQVRSEWGLRSTDVAVGYIGRFSAEKNPAIVARTVARLGEPHQAIYVGPIAGECAEAREAQRQAGPRCRFLPPVEFVGDAFVGLDAFVLASPSEGFCLALAEAWANRVPTLATRVGAVPELEETHGPMVLPIPVDPTPDDVAAAIGKLGTAEARAVVENAHRVVLDGLLDRHFAARFDRYVRDLLVGWERRRLPAPSGPCVPPP